MRIVWNVFLRCRSFAINMEWTWSKIRQDSEIPAGTGEPRTTWGFHDVLLARFRWVWRFFSPQFRRIYDFGEKPRVTTPTARNVKILREVFAQDLMCFYIYILFCECLMFTEIYEISYLSDEGFCSTQRNKQMSWDLRNLRVVFVAFHYRWDFWGPTFQLCWFWSPWSVTLVTRLCQHVPRYSQVAGFLYQR